MAWPLLYLPFVVLLAVVLAVVLLLVAVGVLVAPEGLTVDVAAVEGTAEVVLVLEVVVLVVVVVVISLDEVVVREMG